MRKWQELCRLHPPPLVLPLPMEPVLQPLPLPLLLSLLLPLPLPLTKKIQACLDRGEAWWEEWRGLPSLALPPPPPPLRPSLSPITKSLACWASPILPLPLLPTPRPRTSQTPRLLRRPLPLPLPLPLWSVHPPLAAPEDPCSLPPWTSLLPPPPLPKPAPTAPPRTLIRTCPRPATPGQANRILLACPCWKRVILRPWGRGRGTTITTGRTWMTRQAVLPALLTRPPLLTYPQSDLPVESVRFLTSRGTPLPSSRATTPVVWDEGSMWSPPHPR
mmetsp:Transcript_23851/g.39927  ORF Transcript_23851/g.39927 Transcript_23851/m.39927 type:complete len:275 (+) Transcript_23851:1706-2530(+)